MLRNTLILSISFFLSLPLWSFTLDSMQAGQESIRGILLTHKGKVLTGHDKNVDTLKTGEPIFTGDQISTTSASAAVIVLKSNSLLIIGPETSLTIGDHSPSQLQHIHVQRGRLRMQKRPGREKSPNGSVFTFSRDPHIYQADEFEINLTTDIRTLVLIKGQLNKLTQHPY